MMQVTAEDLGIDTRQAHGLYQWLLASFLIGKRIRASVAVQAYRTLVDSHGLATPGKLAACSHRELVRLLGQAGYARYDESTARRLRVLGARLEKGLEAQLEALRQGVQDVAGFEQWLLGFEGVGPKTLEIFMREAAQAIDAITADAGRGPAQPVPS
jgi:endonuclease III